MKINLGNLHRETRELEMPSTSDIDAYYNTYLTVCRTFKIKPTVSKEELEIVHNRARVLLSEYIRRFPESIGVYPLVVLPLDIDENTFYIAQIQDGQVKIGIVTKDVMKSLNIGGTTNECEN